MIGSDVLMGPQTLVEVERLNIVVGRERANHWRLYPAVCPQLIHIYTY